MNSEKRVSCVEMRSRKISKKFFEEILNIEKLTVVNVVKQGGDSTGVLFLESLIHE